MTNYCSTCQNYIENDPCAVCEGTENNHVYYEADFRNLPTVQQEQKHGYWIVTDIPNLTSTAQDVVTFTRQCRCSECGAMFGRESDKYCYNCGTRMEGETE